MAFCSNCGASVEGRFCAKCGTAMPAEPGAGYQASASPGYSAPAASAGGLTDNVAGALCYVLGILTGIIFLVLAPYNKSKFVRFHAFQAIFFHLAFIVLYIVDTVFALALPWSLHLLTTMLWLLVSLGGLV